MTNPWTNVYGTARSVLALGTLLTLLSNSAVVLFSPAADGVVHSSAWLIRLTLFGALHNHLELGRWLAVVALAVTVVGWRPRVTGVLHWYVAWSFMATCVPSDGGDQVGHILALLLLPVTLTDRRRWHWDPAPVFSESRWEVVLSRVAVVSLAVTRLQGAVIYFNAAVAKFGVAEWTNGTAMYYWLLDPRIGWGHDLRHVVLWATNAPLAVAAMSWLPILLELTLVFTLAMSADNPLRKPLFWLGLAFHAGNILFFGLVSFFCSMSAVLVFMTRPPMHAFDFSWARRLGAALFSKLAGVRTSLRAHTLRRA